MSESESKVEPSTAIIACVSVIVGAVLIVCSRWVPAEHVTTAVTAGVSLITYALGAASTKPLLRGDK